MKFKEKFKGKWCINKSILDYASTKDQEIYNIPLAHQNRVMDRFDKSREHSERLLDWDEAKEMLKSR